MHESTRMDSSLAQGGLLEIDANLSLRFSVTAYVNRRSMTHACNLMQYFSTVGTFP